MSPRKPIIEWTAILIAVLSMLATAYGQYVHDDKNNSSRISALEAHRDDDEKRLGRIEDDVKDVRKDVKSLVEWALGKR